MSPDELLGLDTWGRLDLVDEVVRLRTELATTAAERDALRASVEGRPTAPTDAEIAAHEKTGGRWRCLVPNSLVFCADALHGHAARYHRDTVAAAGFDSVWWALGPDGRPCAWPEASRG